MKQRQLSQKFKSMCSLTLNSEPLHYIMAVQTNHSVHLIISYMDFKQHGLFFKLYWIQLKQHDLASWAFHKLGLTHSEVCFIIQLLNLYGHNFQKNLYAFASYFHAFVPCLCSCLSLHNFLSLPSSYSDFLVNLQCSQVFPNLNDQKFSVAILLNFACTTQMDLNTSHLLWYIFRCCLISSNRKQRF